MFGFFKKKTEPVQTLYDLMEAQSRQIDDLIEIGRELSDMNRQLLELNNDLIDAFNLKAGTDLPKI